MDTPTPKPKRDVIGDYQRLAEEADRERKRAKRRERRRQGMTTPDAPKEAKE